MPDLPDPLPLHPYAGLFPPLVGEVFEALKEDIRARGLDQPALTFRGAIVEGQNRERACRELGIPLKTQEWEGDEAGLLDFVVSANLHRRHLTSSQRAAVAVLLKGEFDSQAAERMLAGTSADGKAGGRGRKKNPPQGPGEGSADRHAGEAAARAARAVGSNRQYVADAIRLWRKSPDLFGQVHRGELTIPKAIKQLDASHAAVGEGFGDLQPGDMTDAAGQAPSWEPGPAPAGDNIPGGTGGEPRQPDDANSASGDGGDSSALSGDPVPTPPDPAGPGEVAAARPAATAPPPEKGRKKKRTRTADEVWRDLTQAVDLLNRIVCKDARRVSRLAHKDAKARSLWDMKLSKALAAVQELQKLVASEATTGTTGNNGVGPAAGPDPGGVDGAGDAAPGGLIPPEEEGPPHLACTCHLAAAAKGNTLDRA